MNARAIHPVTRRGFLQASVALAAANTRGRAAEKLTPPAGATLCLFSKPLGGRSVAELPEVLHKLRCDAVDLTCRPGGHVQPERVADDLPKAHEVLKTAGIRILMLTTAITDASGDHAEAIFQTASALDIRFLKLGYFPYSNLHGIEPTLRDVKSKLRGLVALAGQHKVKLGFHNHSGLNVGSPLWDLHGLIEDLPPGAIGSYFDAAHATVEGGNGGWQIGLNLLAPRIIMMSVKDFAWERSSKGTWQDRWGPLGQGMVQWMNVLTRMKEARFAGPISLHVEYLKSAPPNSEEEKQLLKAVAKDWTTMRELGEEAGLIARV